MQKLLSSLLVLLPGAAFAHGAHPPVPEALHGAAHGMPLALVLMIIGAALAVAWRNRS